MMTAQRKIEVDDNDDGTEKVAVGDNDDSTEKNSSG